MPNPIDPNQKISPAEVQYAMALTQLTLPMMPILLGWDKTTSAPSPGFTGAAAVLDVVERVMGPEPVAALRGGVASGDPRALAAAEALQPLLPPIAEMSLARCLELRAAGRWMDVLSEARLAARIAETAGRWDQVVMAYFCQAYGFRGLQDPHGAIWAYEQVLKIVPEADSKTRSAAHDNLANVLNDVGRLDEAQKHYEEAERLEKNPRACASILHNHARLLFKLGEFYKASALHQKALSCLSIDGADPNTLAIMTDFDAQLLEREGLIDKAIAAAEKAAALFPASQITDRAINARLRASLHHRCGDDSAAAKAYAEATALAEQVAERSINEAMYRAGFAAAHERRLPMTDDAIKLIHLAMAREASGETEESETYFVAAINRALNRNDEMTALRAEADLAAQKQMIGEVAKAVSLALQVRHRAMTRGLALPESMALGTLSSLRDDRAEIDIDPLFGYARAARLLDLHGKIAADAKIPDDEARWEQSDGGALENQLAKMAERHGAYDAAVQHAKNALALAEKLGADWRLPNRLAGLLKLLTKSGKAAEAEKVVGRLRALVAPGKLEARARLVAHGALANHSIESAPAQALEDFKIAVAAAEEIRSQIQDLAQRAATDRQYHDIYPKYAMLLRKAGNGVGAFTALQFGKGRGLLDAAQARGAGDGQPPDLAQARAALDSSDTLVDLAVESGGVAAYIVTKSSFDVVYASGDLRALEESDLGEIQQRAAHLVEICRDNQMLSELVAAIDERSPPNNRVILAPDLGLHNLPLHIVPVGGQAWCDRVSIGYAPSAAVLLSESRHGGRSAFVAGDSRGDLPGAAAECDEIAKLYGVTAHKGPACSLKALEAALDAGPLDVVHLAVHGRGNPLKGDQASLMLANDVGGPELVGLEALANRPWPVGLVVLSGCSTGLGGPRQGYELVSVASRILQAGASAVVASLWPIGDAAARAAMVAFHKALADEKDLRAALDVGRATLRGVAGPASPKARDGREVSSESETFAPPVDPQIAALLDWASFVVVGKPS